MSLFRISRLNVIRNGRHPVTSFAYYSDDGSKKDAPSNEKDSDSDDDKEKKVKKPIKADNEARSKRLNDLLSMMSIDVKITKEVAKPRSAAEKKERKKTLAAKKKEPAKSTDINEAAKEVAETLGGDVKKTQSELLSMLLNSDSETARKDLNSLIGSMKVEASGPPFERRSEFVKKTIARNSTKASKEEFPMREGMQRPKRERRDPKSKAPRVSVDLFGGKPIGIFTNVSDLQDSPDILSTWNYLQNREQKLAVTNPPKNYFEKMAIWTDQGKLWKFPIDNEQGMDDEAKNYFTEHIFLEQHLESWCPTKGPVRHFMELVCVGLSKNPYYTVAQKREHIEWYRDYFAEKRELLDSVIVDSNTTKELHP